MQYLSDDIQKGQTGPAEMTREEFEQLLSSYPLVSVAELEANDSDEPIEWLVEGLIPKGNVVQLCGLPGHLKTWLAMHLGDSIGGGKPFLGRRVEAGHVLYIDRENPKGLLKQRFKLIGCSSEKVHLWPRWADPEPPLVDSAKFNKYTQLAKAFDLLIFDSLRRFHIADENSPQQIAVVMDKFRDLIKYGATVLVLHHAGKAEGSTYRGSTEILANVDVSFSLAVKAKDPKSTCLQLKCEKHRWIEEPNLDLEFATDESGHLTFHDRTTNPEKEAKEKLGNVWGVMCRLKREKGILPNQSQILQALKDQLGIGKDAALSLLQEGEGKLWRSEPEGVGKPRHYRPATMPRWIIPD